MMANKNRQRKTAQISARSVHFGSPLVKSPPVTGKGRLFHQARTGRRQLSLQGALIRPSYSLAEHRSSHWNSVCGKGGLVPAFVDPAPFQRTTFAEWHYSGKEWRTPLFSLRDQSF